MHDQADLPCRRNRSRSYWCFDRTGHLALLKNPVHVRTLNERNSASLSKDKVGLHGNLLAVIGVVFVSLRSQGSWVPLT
jgi:hypothetical protein